MQLCSNLYRPRALIWTDVCGNGSKSVHWRQKVHSDGTYEENLDMCKSDPKYVTKFIDGDESWVFELNPEAKRELSVWYTPVP